jgi:hypothetical protein
LSRPPAEVNRYAEAFKERYNAIGLIALAVASAILMNPLPLIAGAVLEGVYLAVVPRSEWYLKRLSSKFDAEIVRRRQKLRAQLFPKIRPELQSRFDHLEQARGTMAEQVPGEQKWFREVLRKLDYLLDKFLEFASKEGDFRVYLRSVLEETLREKMANEVEAGGSKAFVKSRSAKLRWAGEPPSEPADKWISAVVSEIQGHYDTESDELNRQRTADPEDLTTNAVLDKRVEIIRRRRDYVGQIGKITGNLNHQLELMEDTFGLISDEIRARSPEQILADIDEVIGKTDALTDILQDISPMPMEPVQSVSVGGSA